MIRRCGGTVVGLLAGKTPQTLADIRNDAAHGYPFDGLPWAGLLELVRDLIDCAYRDFRVELPSGSAVLRGVGFEPTTFRL
jgi:hypothetical protein